MKIKPRTLAHTIKKAMKTFPAVVVTGPRQSGKTTLLRDVCGRTHQFVSLENPDVRIRAKEDPVGFIEANPPPVIFDEIQYVPELLSYIKTKIDERRRPGQWLFTGSQNFTLMQGVSQSLAGRAAILSLLPFSFAERIGNGKGTRNVADWFTVRSALAAPNIRINLAECILRGFYPEIASRPSVDRQLWCSSYIATYLERDVRNLAQIGDLTQFERFLKLCATRTGQILNMTDMARDVGVSVPTARRWISMLETGHQIYLLAPYYRNIGKRLIKSPKLYFNDTALASYLLGLHDASALLASPHLGSLFETMIVIDVLKRFLHSGQMPSMYYLRTRDGLEVDLIVELGERLHALEIKTAGTITPAHAASLVRFRNILPKRVGNTMIVSTSTDQYSVGRDVLNIGWKQLLAR